MMNVLIKNEWKIISANVIPLDRVGALLTHKRLHDVLNIALHLH
jgi:hypothetical protein